MPPSKERERKMASTNSKIVLLICCVFFVGQLTTCKPSFRIRLGFVQSWRVCETWKDQTSGVTQTKLAVVGQ